MTNQYQLHIFGSNFSPFTRRLTLALDFSQLTYTQTALGTANNHERLRELHPQARLPVLKINDAFLYDSSVIIEWLNQNLTHSLFPANQNIFDCLQKQGIGISLIEKSVSIFYELTRRDEQFRSPKIIQHTIKQIADGFKFLEKSFQSNINWVNAQATTHADIAIFVAFQFAHEALPEMMNHFTLPNLKQFENFCLQHSAFKNNILPPSPVQVQLQL